MLRSLRYRVATVLAVAMWLWSSVSIAQTDPILGAKTLRIFRTTGVNYVELQPPAALDATYSLQWGSQSVGRNALLYAHGYTTPPEFRLTNSSTTAGDILRMSNDDPPVPGWYPRNTNIWATSGGNPFGGASYVSSGELGAAPDVGSQWFGTSDAWPLYLVAGSAAAVPPNNLVRGVMSED